MLNHGSSRHGFQGVVDHLHLRLLDNHSLLILWLFNCPSADSQV